MTEQAITCGGSPEHLMQDESRDLSKWFASKPDARLRVREACEAIRASVRDDKAAARAAAMTGEGGAA